MEKILVAIENKTNADLIADLLGNHYCVLFYEKKIDFVPPADLIIVDGRTLTYLIEKKRILKNESDPLFLPVLLATPKEDVSLISSHLWRNIDEIITTPIAKMELLVRVEILLRTRRQSVQINKQNALLTLENKSLQLESKKLLNFFTNMSHELKTPLAVILSGIDFLTASLSDDLFQSEICSKTLVISKKNSLRLLRIINNMLDLTKFDSGYMKLNLKNIDLKKSLHDIVESVQVYAHEKQINLVFDSDENSFLTVVDESKFERIILNLLSNAIKFTQPQGRINVTLHYSLKEEKIILTVKDNGIGIPKDKQRVIFDRFIQADNSLSRRSEGCGLGLSLVKSLVELHGGRIWVESMPGIGSKFSFELPARLVASDCADNFILCGIENSISYEFAEL